MRDALVAVEPRSETTPLPPRAHHTAPAAFQSPVAHIHPQASAPRKRGRPRKDCDPVYESDNQELTEEPDSEVEYTGLQEGEDVPALPLGVTHEEAREVLAGHALDAAERGEVPTNMDKYTYVPRDRGDSAMPKEHLPTFGWERDVSKVGDKKGYGMKTIPSEMVRAHHSPFEVVRHTSRVLQRSCYPVFLVCKEGFAWT